MDSRDLVAELFLTLVEERGVETGKEIFSHYMNKLEDSLKISFDGQAPFVREFLENGGLRRAYKHPDYAKVLEKEGKYKRFR